MPWIGRVSLLYGRIRDYDRAGVRGCFCVDDNDLLRQRDQTEESGGKKKKGGEIGWCNSILERERRRGGGERAANTLLHKDKDLSTSRRSCPRRRSEIPGT